jgi:hypothetical protein
MDGEADWVLPDEPATSCDAAGTRAVIYARRGVVIAFRTSGFDLVGRG